MKAISVLPVQEKKSLITIPDSIITASQVGFYGFIKIFLFIFLLEGFKNVTGISENFRFDIIDILISLAAFIYNFLITFVNYYHKNNLSI
jgi:hypothetical protein